MNVSHLVKWIWWAPARCATRSVHNVMKYYEFEDLSGNMHPTYPGKSDGYTHNIGIPIGYEDYKIVILIRNPYSRMVSTWNLEAFIDKSKDSTPKISFDIFARNKKFIDFDTAKKTKAPDYFIRYENLQDDVINLPFLDKTDTNIQEIISQNISTNNYSSSSDDYKKYYTEELANIVYNINKKEFEAFSYDKNSWK